MIEEYKLDDSLAPYYEVPVGPSRSSAATAGTSGAGYRCFPSSSGAAKPALRTVSIIETLSELTGATVGSIRPNYKVPAGSECGLVLESKSQGPAKVFTEAAMVHARRKKTTVTAETHGVPQQVNRTPGFPKKLERSLEVPRPAPKAVGVTRKGRSVEDVLVSEALISKPSGEASIQGYGSLERRRRRRPGTRSSASLARRGETDWEREEDEEEETLTALFVSPHPAAQKANFAKVVADRKQQDLGTVERRTTRTELKMRQRPLNAGPKERGQTPDWIHKIFEVARRESLANLQRAVSGMEVTLVRNLSDHRGNNLLHVVAAAGKAEALAWLCSAYGPEMQGALYDENKRGLTPIVAAIQAGRLEALQFLVEETSARDRLAPIDGDRALLHIAAKYGKVDIVAWLSQYMVSHGYEVDLRDHCAHTPLHLAARAGNASAVAILVAHGADVSAKNDMGHRPLDLASAYGHIGVAQLLRLHDAALGLATETLEFSQELDHLRGDYAELKSYFRDVLMVAKRLAKERDEMCRQLGRLYEDVTSLHHGLLLELRALHREVAGTRDRVTPSKKSAETAESLDDSVAAVETLHERWQNQQRSWFSSSLADMEHRLLVAEDGWKRLRSNSHAKHRQCQIQPHELLRSRLAAINAQSTCQQCDVAILSSSEGSLYSAGYDEAAAELPEDPEENLSEIECETCFSPPKLAAVAASSPSIPAAAANPIPKKPTNPKPFVDVSMETSSVYSSRSTHLPPSAASSSSPAAASVIGALETDKRKASKLEIRKKLHEFKLTSESGNASVIEIIEPSSSDLEDEPDCQPQDQSTPKHSVPFRSFNSSFSDELAKARMTKTRPGTGTEKQSAASGKVIVFPEPDLLAGTVYRDVGEAAENEAEIEADYDNVATTSSTRSGSSLSNPLSGAGRKKGKFLTKFALKARWPTKKKATAETAAASTSSDSPELAAEEAALTVVRSSPEEASASTETENAVANGVVAGLSQMFEDMNKAAATPPVSCAESKRGPSRSSAASSNSEMAESSTRAKREVSTKEFKNNEESIPPPPPTSSPPPDVEESSSHEKTLRSRMTTPPSHPPPPPRLSSHLTKSSGDLSKVSSSSAATPSSSSASSSTSASHGGAESLSVAASEDSGIVIARPASSGYTLAALKGFPLRKASSVSGELLQQDSSLTSADRLSPAPSDLSKTESALSPPSHASDLSKTESMRHFRQLARIEEAAANNSNAGTSAGTEGLREEKKSEAQHHGTIKKSEMKMPGLVEMATQSGQILTWQEAKLKNQVVTPPPLEERHIKGRVRLDDKSVRTLKKRQLAERPWYDVSDDESDLLTPERLTSLTTSRSSSEEDIEV